METMSAAQILINAVIFIFSTITGALLIQWATAIMGLGKSPFGAAYNVSLIDYLLGAVVQKMIEWKHPQISPVIAAVYLVALFFIHILLVGILIRDADGDSIGIGRGILVAIVEIPVAIGLCFALFLAAVATCVFLVASEGGSLEKAVDRLPDDLMKAVPWSRSQPNQFRTVDEAKREAVRQHPELGVAGSRFNRAYLERHQQYQRDRPGYFEDNNWPVTLADEIATEE